MRTAQDIVTQEVLVCLSSLVSTLAGVSGMSQSAIDADLPAWELFNAAVELAAPIDDWEEAAREAGWKTADLTPGLKINESMIDATLGQCLSHNGDWMDICADYEIDPYQREVFEHWAVTEWFADQLLAKGEKVDKDFAGMCVWARTTTGQAIYADSVVEQIAADLAKAVL